MRRIAALLTLATISCSADTEFEPHEIEARVRIDRLDGESLELDEVPLVEGSSERAEVDTTFDFTLEPEWSAPGATYVVELRERPGDQQAGLPQRAATNPSQGPMPIGFESDPMAIHYLELDTLPAINQAQLDALGAALYEQLPVQHVSLSLGDTIPYSGAPQIQPILDAVMAARSAARSPEPAQPSNTSSTSASARSRIAKPSPICSTVMQSGGLTMKLLVPVKVNRPSSRRHLPNFAMTGCAPA